MKRVRRLVLEIKLKRTDTTLDLSQKAKRAVGRGRGREANEFINAASAKYAKNTNDSRDRLFSWTAAGWVTIGEAGFEEVGTSVWVNGSWRWPSAAVSALRMYTFGAY